MEGSATDITNPTPPGTGDAPAKTGDTAGESAKPPEATTNGQPPAAPKPPERPAPPESADAKVEKNAAYYARNPDELVAVVTRAQEINPDGFTSVDTPPGKTEADFDAAVRKVKLETEMELAYRDAALELKDKGISVEDVKMLKASTPDEVMANAKYLADRFDFERAKAAGETTQPGDPPKPGHLTKLDAKIEAGLDNNITVDTGNIPLPSLAGDTKTALEEAEAQFDKVLNDTDIKDLIGRD